MKIAIASGKGGTGKTTVAVNLALLLSHNGTKMRYLDCDVEEPNGHLFIKPQIDITEQGSIPVPIIDEKKCTACGECVRMCQYKALVRLGTMVMVFPELCHGCGGCTMVCPEHAITEQNKNIGAVEIGTSNGIEFVHGRLNIGEAMSPPLIRKVLSHTTDNIVNIIDSPPGTSCPVIASIRDADYVLLVTEPTPFGLNDLSLAIDMVRKLGVPHSVVVNRAEDTNAMAHEFCAKRQTKIIAEIPDDRRIAESYSRGEMIYDAVPGIASCFENLWKAMARQVK